MNKPIAGTPCRPLAAARRARLLRLITVCGIARREHIDRYFPEMTKSVMDKHIQHLRCQGLIEMVGHGVWRVTRKRQEPEAPHLCEDALQAEMRKDKAATGQSLPKVKVRSSNPGGKAGMAQAEQIRKTVLAMVREQGPIQRNSISRQMADASYHQVGSALDHLKEQGLVAARGRKWAVLH